MMDEKLLVQETLAGDQTAFARLVEAYQTPVFNLAYRFLGDGAEAEDAAQETFVRVYEHLHEYQTDKKLSSWILSITSHYCIDRLRRRRWNWFSLDDLMARNAFADPDEEAEKMVLDRDEQAAIHTLLQALPEQHRLVLILRYWQELSYWEMAEVLGTTETAVKSRLHRARCMLAERMKAEEPQPRNHKARPTRLDKPSAMPLRLCARAA